METRADEFVTQAREHLAVLEQVLLSLEKPEESAETRERVDRCLRLVHSLKGDAGFLGYTAIRILANAMETVLERLRNREAPASAAAIEQLLVARDRLATLVDDLEGESTRQISARFSRNWNASGLASASASIVGHRPPPTGPRAFRPACRVFCEFRALRPCH